jgi:flagellar basal body-associated protein FliL
MVNLIIILGLVGFLGGVVGVVAMLAQRDANKEREKKAAQKDQPPP